MFRRMSSTKKRNSKTKAPAARGLAPAGSSFFRECRDVKEAYAIGEELGRGGFAIVSKGTDLDDGSEWALKMIKQEVYKKNKKSTDMEVAILNAVNHRGVVKIREVLLTDKCYVIVLELLEGGELFDRIIEREKYSEKDAVQVTQSILQTIAHLHQSKCAHRDLKPENLIFKNTSEQAPLLLTDFGFAEMFKVSGQMDTSCGTPEYVAPEVLAAKGGKGVYSEVCDVWSIGVITYILLCGFPPFYSSSPNGGEKELFQKIARADFSFPSPYWDPVSKEAKDFVKKLLKVDPKKRPSASKALSHPWIQGGGDRHRRLASQQINLKQFMATRKFRTAVFAVIAAERIKMAFVGVGIAGLDLNGGGGGGDDADDKLDDADDVPHGQTPIVERKNRSREKKREKKKAKEAASGSI